MLNELQKNTCKIKICERNELPSFITELKLQEEGITKSDKSFRLSNMAPMALLVTGSIAQDDEFVSIFVKVIDLEKGTIVISNTLLIPQDELIKSYRKRTRYENGKLTLSEKIQSENNFSNLLSDFFVANWSWLWTALFLPIYVWAMNKIKKKN